MPICRSPGLLCLPATLSSRCDTLEARLQHYNASNASASQAAQQRAQDLAEDLQRMAQELAQVWGRAEGGGLCRPGRAGATGCGSRRRGARGEHECRVLTAPYCRARVRHKLLANCKITSSFETLSKF